LLASGLAIVHACHPTLLQLPAVPDYFFCLALRGGLQKELSIGSGLWCPADEGRARTAGSSLDVQLAPIESIDAI
jgi:hypothetical protein